MGTNAAGQKYVQITVQDIGSGLATILVTTSTNADTSVPDFSVGTTAPVVVTPTKIDQSLGSQVALRVADVAGNVADCDPVLTSLTDHAGPGGWQVFGNLGSAESKVQITNGDPGLRRVMIIANGKRFRVTGLRNDQVVTVDVAAAMRPGDGNTIALRGEGKPLASADALIWDGSGQPPTSESPAATAVAAATGVTVGMEVSADDGANASDDLVTWQLGSPDEQSGH